MISTLRLKCAGAGFVSVGPWELLGDLTGRVRVINTFMLIKFAAFTVYISILYMQCWITLNSQWSVRC